MKCLELMKRHVAYALESAPVASAARTMRDRGAGFLPVCNDAGDAVGTITDRDIALRVLADGLSPAATRVGEVMTSEILSCSPDDDIGIAEDLMREFQVSRIVCTDGQRHVVGVISLSDIADADQDGAGQVFATIAAREADGRTAGTVSTCRDLMQGEVECIQADEPARAAAMRMRDRGVGALPVCDERGMLGGIVTDRDLVLRMVAEGMDADAPIGKATTLDVATVEPDDSILRAEDLMRERHVSRVVCVEGQRPVGIVSLADLPRYQTHEHAAEVLRDVTARSGMAEF